MKSNYQQLLDLQADSENTQWEIDYSIEESRNVDESECSHSWTDDQFCKWCGADGRV